MSSIYLTPASISYLAQFILSLAITVFLVYRLWNKSQNRPTQLILLTGFFAAVTVFIGLLFLDAALSPFPRLFAVYAQNSVLALALVFLLQFAYRFPRPFPRRTWESRASLVVSLGYLLWEASYMVYRYSSLLGQETVQYRPILPDYANALILLWVPVAFLRQSVAADPRPVNGLAKLWKPQGKEARGARSFVFVFGMLFVLGAINILRTHSVVSTALYNVSLSLGILAALWLFASAYINFIPGGVSVLARLSILTLTLFLAVLGSVGWMIAPPYIATYRPDLVDRQTLRFTPSSSGGYDVTLVDFAFEPDLGDRLPVQATNKGRNHKANFAFPFYGQSYTQVYVASSGVVSMGEPFWQPNMQARCVNAPAIFPLMIDLNPNAGGGLYARQEPDRLILTWDHLPAQYRPGAIFTFQTVLYANGVFDITTNGLPLPFRFDPDETPSANPWVRGAVPGRGERLHTNVGTLTGPFQENQLPIVQNYHLDFRQYLHVFMLPLAWVVIGGSLMLMLVLPLLLHHAIARPLHVLLDGVQQMEAGDLDVKVAVQNRDEIGVLTLAFNKMTSRLNDLVVGLERRVAARTEELDRANAQLRAEIVEREQTQATVVEQQRVLAAFDERERLGRELHDGLGQVLVYINVQAQAAEQLLGRGQAEAVRDSLHQLAQAAREGHADVRDHILGLRSADGEVETAEPRDLETTLEAYAQQFQARYGLKVRLWLPKDLLTPLFAPRVEEQALRIVREAMTNAGKHARATQVEVILRLIGDLVQIVVVDDGVGFDTNAQYGSDDATHFGLAIMRERAERFGGALEIHSAPGEGTRVSATLPRLLPMAEREMDDPAALRDVRLLLADDHPLFLDGLRNMLVARGLTVIGVARDGREVLEKTRALRPDVVVMDLNMPHGGGLEATRAIKAEFPEVKIVILTVSEDDASLFEAVKSGASGYLLKSLEANQFCRLLSGVVRGDAPLAPGMGERVLGEFVRSAAPDELPPEEILTPRQLEVLGLVAQGLTYKEVGEALSLSEETIKYHIGNILRTLHVENRAQAIAYFQQRRR